MSHFRREFREATAEARWSASHVILWLIVPLMALTTLLGTVGWGLGWFGRAADRIASADAAIDGYEWFVQQYQDVRAVETQLADAERAVATFKTEAGPREGWRYDERQESARLTGIVQGLRQERTRRIQDYNARSKMVTRNLWKPKGELPYQIELD